MAALITGLRKMCLPAGLGSLVTVARWNLDLAVWLLALTLPDTVLPTVIATQAEGSGYEVNGLVSPLASIPVHTDSRVSLSDVERITSFQRG